VTADEAEENREDHRHAQLLFWARVAAVAAIAAVVIGALALALAVTAVIVVFRV
jgi:hypothetical protein